MTVTAAGFAPTDPSPASHADSRLVGLDALRFLAAGLVFAHHLVPAVILPGAGRGLDVGVMVFFALSGFVLYRPLLVGRPSPWSFLVRRIARVWPAYLVAAVAVAVLLEPASLANPIGLVTMGATPLGVTWTLKLELVFYLLLPLIGRVMRGQSDRQRLAVIVGFAAFWLAIGAAASSTASSVPTGYAMWAFAPGMVVAELSVSRPTVLSRRRLLAAFGLVLVALSVLTDSPYPDFAGGIGAALLLPCFASWRPGRWSSSIALAGGISYSVYLWHLPLVLALGIWSIPATVAVALAVFVVVERPGIAAGRRAGATLDNMVERRRLRRFHIPTRTKDALPLMPEAGV